MITQPSGGVVCLAQAVEADHCIKKCSPCALEDLEFNEEGGEGNEEEGGVGLRGKQQREEDEEEEEEGGGEENVKEKEPGVRSRGRKRNPKRRIGWRNLAFESVGKWWAER